MIYFESNDELQYSEVKRLENILSKLELPKSRKITFSATLLTINIKSKLRLGDWEQVKFNYYSNPMDINKKIKAINKKLSKQELKYRIKNKMHKDILNKIKKLNNGDIKVYASNLTFMSVFNVWNSKDGAKGGTKHFKLEILWSHELQAWQFSNRVNSYDVALSEQEALTKIQELFTN